MHYQSDYEMIPTNAILSSSAGAYAFFVANLEPLLTVGLPIAFFVIGKGIDIAIKLYLHSKEKR